MNGRARALWARTSLRVWPERYMVVSLPTVVLAEAIHLVAAAAGSFASIVLERDELAVTVPEDLWASDALRPLAEGEAGPYRAITLDIDLDLDVCGFLAPAAVKLASAGVSIVPQCGYRKDHLLVPEASIDKATRTLERLINSCRD
jgi:hypothetical protein